MTREQDSANRPPAENDSAGHVPENRPAPEKLMVQKRQVVCDGASSGGRDALGHPRVYLVIGEAGFVDCSYCDRRFELEHGASESH